jgi:hypothetical protein
MRHAPFPSVLKIRALVIKSFLIAIIQRPFLTVFFRNWNFTAIPDQMDCIKILTISVIYNMFLIRLKTWCTNGGKF